MNLEETKQAFLSCKEGDKFRGWSEKRPYKVAYRNERFVVIVKPMFGTVNYSIVDTEEWYMGPNDWIFNPFDLTKREDIVEMINQILTKDGTVVGSDLRNTRISRRRGINVFAFDKFISI